MPLTIHLPSAGHPCSCSLAVQHFSAAVVAAHSAPDHRHEHSAKSKAAAAVGQSAAAAAAAAAGQSVHDVAAGAQSAADGQTVDAADGEEPAADAAAAQMTLHMSSAPAAVDLLAVHMPIHVIAEVAVLQRFAVAREAGVPAGRAAACCAATPHTCHQMQL